MAVIAKDGNGPDHAHRLTVADRVTLGRVALTTAITALVVHDLFAAGPRPAASTVLVVALASAGLVLDGVDGWVARHTGTASEFGARFDPEADSFLVLVLTVAVAHEGRPWVLALGLVRYGFVAASQIWPSLARPLPPRYWRKVVAVVQGIVLTVAVSGVLPEVVVTAGLVVALALLAESFGRDLWWLLAEGTTGTTGGQVLS